jgi:hemolysin activation/secretion protein
MRFAGIRRPLIVAAALMCSLAPAMAQPSSEPSHVDERFRPQPAAPSVGAPIEIPSTQQPAAPGGAQAISFTLSAISFEGNKAIPESRLQALAAPYIGRPVTLAQIYELADKITAEYRAAGYILARAIVPAQKLDNGHLKLQIIEGFIGSVKIEGDAGGARPYLEAYGRRIQAMQPLTAKVLERELLLVSDLAGFQVRSVLTPSTVPGAADLTLVVDRKAVDAYLSVDNRGSKYLGPYEIQGGVFFNDAFSTGGRLGLNAVVTPDKGPDMAYGAISFDQPIGFDGMRSFTTISYTRTRPGAELRAFDTKGRALNGDTSLSYPFIRSRDFNLIGSFGLSYHDVESENFAVKPLFDDHIRSINAAVYINTLDSWGGYTTVTGRVTEGLQIFGATRDASPNKSRVDASGSYTRGNIDISRDQPLWDRFSVLLGASGQTSFGKSLLASEQYSLGGDSYNRAYDPSQITGDSALAGKIEPRWNVLDEAGPISAVQLYGFYEGGEVWESHALPGTPEHESLSSGGAGVRFVVAERVNADVEWADPLEHDAFGGSRRDSRVFFSIGTSF